MSKFKIKKKILSKFDAGFKMLTYGLRISYGKKKNIFYRTWKIEGSLTGYIEKNKHLVSN